MSALKHQDVSVKVVWLGSLLCNVEGKECPLQASLCLLAWLLLSEEDLGFLTDLI